MLSIAICTFNRCGSLAVTLESLSRQRPLLAGELEIIIVDNNCTDETARVAASFADRLPNRLTREPQQGLAHARNRALQEFRGDVLLFTDDDITFDPGWLAGYRSAIATFGNAGFFGGRMLPAWPGPQPRWATNAPLDLLDGLIGWYDHGLETRTLEPDEKLPWGASFAVRRELVERIGKFRSDLGQIGSKVGRGEETDYLQRAVHHGMRGVYVGAATCRHAVEWRKLTMSGLLRHGIASGFAHREVGGGTSDGSLLRAGMHVLRAGGQLLKGQGGRSRQCVINAGVEIGLRQHRRMARG